MAGKLKIIILVVIALVSFVASYFVSSLLGPKDVTAAVTAAVTADVTADVSAADKDEGEQIMLPAIAAGGATPVTFKMKTNELNELLKEARLIVDACKARQKQLDNREKHIEMAGETLKKQAQELDVARAQLLPVLQNIQQARAELKATRVRVSKAEKANLKRIAAMYNKMDTVRAAETLTIMCGGGQEDDAVKIIRYMSGKSAGRLLAAMPDKQLVAKICTKLKVFEEEG